MTGLTRLMLGLALVVVCVKNVVGDDETHTYTSDEEVILWINRIGM